MVTSSSIPRWAGKYLRPEDLMHIEQAVQAAESATAAEIVPMLVHRSAGVGHVRRILVLAVMVLALVAWDFLRVSQPQVSPWLFFGVATIVGLVVVWALGHNHALQRWLTDDVELMTAVERRAIAEFQASRITATRNSTGILVFVSLMERRCFVLADHRVAESLPEPTWDIVVSQFALDLRNGAMGKGFVEAIQHMTPIVAKILPILPDDQNEIANSLIIKE